MEYNEWLIGWLIDPGFSPAKAQRRKGETNSWGGVLIFAPLRLCWKSGFGLFAFFFLPILCFAQPRLPMKAADLVRVANVTDAQISPNGQWVVYSVSSVEDDKTISTLWLARLDLDSYSTPIPTPTPRRLAPYMDWPDIRSAPRQLLPSGW